ncbi:MAG: S41 family peptidase [Rhodospirillales bacterium]
MYRWRRFRPALILTFTLAAGAAVSPSLIGCGTEQSPLGQVFNALSGQDITLPQDAVRELERFREVYDAYAADAGKHRRFVQFRDAFKRVRFSYVREVADARLIDAAIKGVRDLNAEPGAVPAGELVETALDSMMSALDPHSAYLNADELRDIQVTTKGEFGGLGIVVTMENGMVKVVSPIEDTPAFRAGLKSGDLITHVDGDPIKAKKILRAVKKLRGPPGTDVRLTVSRSGLAPFDLTITRAIVRVRSVRWRAEGAIGYVRVVNFSEKVEHGVGKAMESLRKDVGPRMKGLVLDLRNNPGGLLNQSLSLADAFLEDGQIVAVRGRAVKDTVYKAKIGDLANGVPMVVLINGGSASASEIVASALQDHGRATVMGMRSFGKGSVQTITRLPMEGGLRLTTALYYAPAGEAIQARGVEPDITLTRADAVNSKRQRESDLPGALPAVDVRKPDTHLTLKETDCPAVGEKKDRTLGCALALLRAGSQKGFLASIGAHKSM